MLIKSVNRLIANVSGQGTLRTFLVVPFVLQIVGTVGLVGYLSFQSGQQAVNDVASQLRQEISDRISDQIRTYLKTPHLINQTNADLIRLGQLDITDPQGLERHFLKQIQVFDSLSRIYFSNPEGGLISIGNDERGLSVAFTEKFARGRLQVESVDTEGNAKKVLLNQSNYDARERPFYQSAVIAGQPTWSPIYVYIPSSRGLGIAASYPFSNEGKLEGILSSDLSLVAINRFLQSLKIGIRGEAFIIERSGLIVASSTTEQPFLSSTDHPEPKRLRATESREPLIQATAQNLRDRFGNFRNINSSEKLDFKREGKREFVQITPFKDEFGLDWLIVVVVPEADFMEQINGNTQITILLCLTALVVATGMGIITAHWITKPLLYLNATAKEIAKGKWDKRVEIKRSDEVGQLAESFNQMVGQLQDYFAKLSSLNEALSKSDRKFRGIFNHAFQFTGMLNGDGILLEINQTALDFGGLQLNDVIGKPFWKCYWWTISAEAQTQLQEAIKRASQGEFIRYEVEVLGANNNVVTIDFSLKPIFDQNNNVEFLIPEGRDITESKQVQKILANYNRILETQVAERTAELERSKHFIERIAEASPNLLYIYDLIEQRNVYVNSAIVTLLGYTPKQIQDMGEALLPTLMHPDDFLQVPPRLQQLFTLSEGEILEFEYRLIDAEQKWRTFCVRETVFERTPDGRVKQLIGTAIDITDRKRVEEALHESLEGERAIARAIQRMRQTLDIETIFSATTSELRHVIHCDRVGIYRFNPDWSGEFVCESVGSEWISLVHEHNNHFTLKQKTLDNKNCVINSFDSEVKYDSIFGTSSFLVEDTYLQQTQGGAYSRGRSHVAVADIYQADFNSCYINLLEQFQARAYIIVPISCGNKLWGLLAAYQNSGSRLWKTTEINVVLQIANQLGVALQQAELLNQTQKQSEALRKSGTRFRQKAQELEQTLAELKRTQVQLIHAEKMSSLGQMIAGIAHEINNPVGFIYSNLGYARQYFQDLLSLIELYQQTYPNATPKIQELTSEIDLFFLLEDWQKLINSMQVGAERITEIVCSLRNFSRLDENELKSVDIHEGIDNTLLILQHRLKAEGSRSEINVMKHYDQLPKVTCYASQLNQVFMNLLSNAIDALELQPPPRVITIRTCMGSGEWGVASDYEQPTTNNQQPTTDSVIIQISDNGSGMNEEIIHKIFDPFFTTKPVGSGTGLGLSICYQIVVEKHQGQIRCTSTPGQGTEFIVQIPLVPIHCSESQ